MLKLNAIVLVPFQAPGWLYKKMLQTALGAKVTVRDYVQALKKL